MKSIKDLESLIKKLKKFGVPPSLEKELDKFLYTQISCQDQKSFSMFDEVFNPILENPDYSVTSFGRVFSHKSDKFLKPCKTPNGYLMVSLCKNGEISKRLVHRLVGWAFRPETHSTDFDINHIDGDKTNNHANNLQWVSRAHNLMHSYEMRRK